MGTGSSNLASRLSDYNCNLNQTYRNFQLPQPLSSHQICDNRLITRFTHKKKGFGTFRRKFLRLQKSGKLQDHVRIFKTFLSTWSITEMRLLLDEYEALAALKDITIQADLARPPAATFKQDLATLFESQFCSDLEIVYNGVSFPAHRAILSARCPYFRNLLVNYPTYGARVPVEFERIFVTSEVFAAVLKYIYTGDLSDIGQYQQRPNDGNHLGRLLEQLVTPNALENDLEYLLEYGSFFDAVLVFQSDSQQQQQQQQQPPQNHDCSDCNSSLGSEYGFRAKLEMRCHKAILGARSQFFHDLFVRRACAALDSQSAVANDRTKNVSTVVLDEFVIPKRFAPVLLHAIYLDTVDLSLIYNSNEFSEPRQYCGYVLNNSENMSSSEHFNRVVPGRYRPSLLDEAMELYQIGRYLDLDILSQGCEDLIADWISNDTIVDILNWSRQPHGSDWVHRQALYYLREEFQTVFQSPVLHQMQLFDLIEVLDSSFVQACELDILQTVIKWSENELLKHQSHQFENNYSQSPNNSGNRKNCKQQVDDEDLRELLRYFEPYIYIEHIVPKNNAFLLQVVKRKLISVPEISRPSTNNGARGKGDEGTDGDTDSDDDDVDRNSIKMNCWIRGNGNEGGELFRRPRFYTPFHDTLKMLYANHYQNLHVLDPYSKIGHLYCQNAPGAFYVIDSESRENEETSSSAVTAATAAAAAYHGEVLLSPPPPPNLSIANASYSPVCCDHRGRPQCWRAIAGQLDDGDSDNNGDVICDGQCGVNNDDREYIDPYNLLAKPVPELSSEEIHDYYACLLAIPNERTLNNMMKRMHKLYSSPNCIRAFLLRLSPKFEIQLQIKLQVAREFKMPDEIVFVLDNQYSQFLQHSNNTSANTNANVPVLTTIPKTTSITCRTITNTKNCSSNTSINNVFV